MKLIRAPTLARAHELAVKYILEHGYIVTTENGEETLETEEICLSIDTPVSPPLVSPNSRFKESFLREYSKNLLHGSDAVFEYDYHSRLYDWGCGLHKDTGPVHQNQIKYIIEKLRANKVTRRAIAVTWNPSIDSNLNDCPCLQLIQCVVRNNSLDMKVVFRSNDMLSACGSNMYALVNLQQYIADELDVFVGKYTHISLVPHIYYKRDLFDIQPFCKSGKEFGPIKEVCSLCGKCK